MTPTQRRKFIRNITMIAVVMVVSLFARFLFLGQSLPSLLLGRKPGSASPGSILVRTSPISSTNLTIRSISSSERPLKIKFDLLTNWKYIEGRTVIPKKVQDLNGKLIEIKGFMLPISETQNISRFVLVNSLWGCCFGQTPAVNHVMVVTMEPGKTVDYYPDPIEVMGRFSVGETREEGFLVSIFRLEGEKVVVH